MFLAVTQAFMAPVSFAPRSSIVMQHGGKGFGGGEATRDPEPTYVDPNDPKGKQQAIHKAESFADYLAKRNAGAGAVTPTAAPAPAPAAAAPAPAAAAPASAPAGEWDGIWGFERQKELFLAWNPDAPRTYTNFNPFERNLDGAKCDANGCFPGESRGYQPPNRPNVDYKSMQEEKVKLEELSKHPNWGLKGKPGCYSLKWQEKLGAPP